MRSFSSVATWKKGLTSHVLCDFSLPGSIMSIVRSCLLNGSVGELSRCLVMIARSMIIPLGRRTGSVIRVFINGSKEELFIYTEGEVALMFLPMNSSGMSLSSILLLTMSVNWALTRAEKSLSRSISC